MVNIDPENLSGISSIQWHSSTPGQGSVKTQPIRKTSTTQRKTRKLNLSVSFRGTDQYKKNDDLTVSVPKNSTDDKPQNTLSQNLVEPVSKNDTASHQLRIMGGQILIIRN